MTDDRIDLSPLDPVRDARGFDLRVQRIVTRALAARAEQRRAGVWGAIVVWRRPALGAALAAAAVATGVIVLSPTAPRDVPASSTSSPTNAVSEIAGSLGVPSPLAASIGARRTPDLADVLLGETPR